MENAAPLSINPNGSVPTLAVEGQGAPPFHLFESFAITQYLATKEAACTPTDRAKGLQPARLLEWTIVARVPVPAGRTLGPALCGGSRVDEPVVTVGNHQL